jgi:hypothetical protein
VVRRIFRPLIEPKPDWLFTRRDEAHGGRKRDRKVERAAPRGESRVDPTGSRRD